MCGGFYLCGILYCYLYHVLQQSNNLSIHLCTICYVSVEEHGPGHLHSDTSPVASQIMRSQTPTGLSSAAPLLPGPPPGGARSSLRSNLPTHVGQL